MIDGFRLSNIWSEHSGVRGAIIGFSCGEFDDESCELTPRIRVALEGCEITAEITLERLPRVLGELPQQIRDDAIKWVIMNRDALLRHWLDETDTPQCLRELIRCNGAPVMPRLLEG